VAPFHCKRQEQNVKNKTLTGDLEMKMATEQNFKMVFFAFLGLLAVKSNKSSRLIAKGDDAIGVEIDGKIRFYPQENEIVVKNMNDGIIHVFGSNDFVGFMSMTASLI
jgi:hypothetical protein